MSIQTITKIGLNDNGHSQLQQKNLMILAKLSEIFWFCLSFVLFLLAGPFSAVVVLVALCSLSRENATTMIEPASL